VNRAAVPLLAVVALAAAVGACSTGPGPPTTYCVVRQFLPVPRLFFVYPGAGVTGVSPSIGELVVAGSTSGYRLRLTGPGGVRVPTGPVGPAPSPLPSPRVSPPAQFNRYSSATIPPLLPATTYVVSVAYTGITNHVPDCIATLTQKLGSFTTR
jgi:hypothetical protein